MGIKDSVTLDIMKILEQMGVSKDKYMTLSSNNPNEKQGSILKNVQLSQKQ